MIIKLFFTLFISLMIFVPHYSFGLGQSKYQEREEKMSTRSNDWIKRKIDSQIKKHPDLKNLNITIEVDNGRVDLIGEVENIQQINELEMITKSIDGIINTNTKKLKEK